MSKKIYVFAILIFLKLSAISQNETKIWYFGSNAGLDFNTTPPTVLTNGQLSTAEGCASVADMSGNLMFYTDGIKVWDKTHAIMENGNGMFGDPSSTQSALIVQKPGSPHIYHIFTMGCCQGSLYYSTVDMTLAGGNGSVTVKNTPVYTGQCTEKLTAARHSNCTDIWILTHDMSNSNFRANLVTATGVSTGGTVSTIGTSHGDYVGCMKVSPDSKRIGLAISNSQESLELYDFDNTTGVVSNSLVLASHDGLPYGIEFSQDASKFYCATYSGNKLHQYDLCAGSNTAIAASHFTLPANGSFGTMQLGPDGKIYISRLYTSTLSVINNPNNYGSSCNYVDYAIDVSPKSLQYGLPNFYSVLKTVPAPPFTYSINCGTSDFFAPSFAGTYTNVGCTSTGYSVTGVTWDFGDPSTGAANVSNQSHATHAFSASGSYTVKLIYNYSCGGGADTVRQTVVQGATGLQLSITGAQQICAGNSVTLTAGGADTYSWSTGAQTSSVVLTPNASMYVTLYGKKSDGSCLSQTFVHVQVNKCTGIEELAAHGTHLYPNPTTGRLTIESAEDLEIQVLSLLGDHVTTINISAPKEVVDLGALAPGMYLLKVKGKDFDRMVRIQKQE